MFEVVICYWDDNVSRISLASYAAAHRIYRALFEEALHAENNIRSIEIWDVVAKTSSIYISF